MFGNTVAFAGTEDVPGVEEDPGSELLGTGVDIAVDLPPQPQTKKMTIDEQKSAMIFETTYQTPGGGNSSIPEQQLWLNENRLLSPMSQFVGRKG
jgi:hypothetical protein